MSRVLISDDSRLRGPRDRSHMSKVDLGILADGDGQGPVTEILSTAELEARLRAENPALDIQISATPGPGADASNPYLALQHGAQETHQIYKALVEGAMDLRRAAFVRMLRVDQKCTWRRVAEVCHAQWTGDWDPPSNQIMGMALCEYAALAFGQEYMKEPWN